MNNNVLKLYRECFPEKSNDMSYFDVAQNISEDYSFVIKEEGAPISIIFSKPATFSIGGKEVNGATINSIFTKEDHRGKGFARRLLIKSMDELRTKGAVVVTLAPHNVKYFDPLGFASFAFSNNYIIKSPSFKAAIDVEESDAEKMLNAYNKYAKNYYSSQVRDLDFMKNRIAKYKLEGKVVACFSDDEIKAYAMYNNENNIEEAIFESKSYLDKLGIDNYRVPSDLGRDDGMMRILDVVEFLKNIGYHDDFVIDMKIKITDNLIKENNCVVRLKTANNVSEVERLSDDEEYDLEYSVQDLVGLIMRSGPNLYFSAT